MIQSIISPPSAAGTIEKLRAVFTQDQFHFDFQCSMYLAGPKNKELRREIMKIVTTEEKPLSQCGLGAVSTALTNHFSQLQLF